VGEGQVTWQSEWLIAASEAVNYCAIEGMTSIIIVRELLSRCLALLTFLIARDRASAALVASLTSQYGETTQLSFFLITLRHIFLRSTRLKALR
jgi:hypothetical protein